MTNHKLYDLDLTALYASVCDYFYDFLDIEFSPDEIPSERERAKILLRAMEGLGHTGLDIALLDKSLTYYSENADLCNHPNFDIECPRFEHYL